MVGNSEETVFQRTAVEDQDTEQQCADSVKATSQINGQDNTQNNSILTEGSVQKQVSSGPTASPRKLSTDGTDKASTTNGLSNGSASAAELIVLDDELTDERNSVAKKRKAGDSTCSEGSVPSAHSGLSAASEPNSPLKVKKVKIDSFRTTETGKDPIADAGKDAAVDTYENLTSKESRASVRRMFKRLTRDELEKIVLEQMCLVLTQKGVTKEMNKKLETAEGRIDYYKRRAEVLQKQVQEFKQVLQRFVTRMKEREMSTSKPKSVRCVGVQISMSDSDIRADQSKQVKQTSKNPSDIIVLPEGKPPAAGGSGSPLAGKAIPVQGIAAYVPQQAIPRYRKTIVAQEISAIVSQAGVKVTSSPAAAAQKPVTPQKPVAVNAYPPKTVALAMSSSDSEIINQLLNSCSPCQPVASSAAAVTTVNKVTLPALQPKVIDLTDDETEKSPAKINKTTPANSTDRPATTQNSTPKSVNVVTASTVNTPSLPNGVSPSLKTPADVKTSPAPSSQPKASGQSSPAKQSRPLVPILPNATHPPHPSGKTVPPRPQLSVSLVADGSGIVLKWNMSLSNQHAKILAYQLYAYQEGTTNHGSSPWRKISDIKALPLPMACTLTQFHVGNRYHFMVRAVDEFSRAGPYSEVKHIMLPAATTSSGSQN